MLLNLKGCELSTKRLRGGFMYSPSFVHRLLLSYERLSRDDISFEFLGQQTNGILVNLVGKTKQVRMLVLYHDCSWVKLGKMPKGFGPIYSRVYSGWRRYLNSL